MLKRLDLFRKKGPIEDTKMQEPIALGYRPSLAGLAHGLDATRAYGHAARLASHGDRGLLNVRVPAALCVAHGVAHIVTELRSTAANLTF